MLRLTRSFKECLEELVAPSFPNTTLNSDTIALVTGGSRGFGWELVLQLAERKLRVIIADMNPPSVLSPTDANIVYYQCNVADYQQIKELRRKIKEQYGIISILFNNAGITCISSLEETSDSDIKKVIDVNYIGAYMMIQTFLPDIIEHGNGYIVNVASVLGIVSPARLTSYGASKGGLIAYHTSLTRRLKRGKSGCVRTLLVCPGKLRTEMFARVETPSKILAPDVDPKQLAVQIMNAIDCNGTRCLNLPYYVNLVALIKTLNWPYLRILKKLSGMDKSTAISVS